MNLKKKKNNTSLANHISTRSEFATRFPVSIETIKSSMAFEDGELLWDKSRGNFRTLQGGKLHNKRSFFKDFEHLR